LSTFCDAPAGSGLGSSSTLVVVMIRAFAELLNLPLDDYTIAHMAYQIERVDCGLQGGRQDQYSATFGGFNFMEFYAEERAIINPLRIKNWIICELESSLVLYFTGVSRESAHIIADQSNNVRSGNVDALEAMHGIKREALTMKECLLRGDFDGLVESMRLGWENKKRSAKTVSNPHIDGIYDAAIKSGALAGKVSGAGGGGFMWFFVPTEKRMDVVRTLNGFGGQVSNCHFTKHGTQAWRIG
jgi:D-glycero-alpha-D-manno-heptose-7-phosphate kinase